MDKCRVEIDLLHFSLSDNMDFRWGMGEVYTLSNNGQLVIKSEISHKVLYGKHLTDGQNLTDFFSSC